MAQWGNTDANANSKPKWALERTIRIKERLIANAVTNSIGSTANVITFVSTGNATANMIISGNNINYINPTPGFFGGNVKITSVDSGNGNVTISAPVSKNVQVGDVFEIDTLLESDYSVSKNDNNYNKNTILVTPGRLANATFGNTTGAGSEVTHLGWNKVTQGTGFVKNVTVTVANSLQSYTNAYVTFGAARGANITSANGRIVVTGAALNVVTFILNSGGSGYANTPTVSASGANNANLVFAVTMGGRAGRVSAECLVALSNCSSANANAGGVYFTGV